jgi:hypothetical protein
MSMAVRVWYTRNSQYGNITHCALVTVQRPFSKVVKVGTDSYGEQSEMDGAMTI